VPKPRLPSHAADIWKGGFVLDGVRDVYSVDVRDGLLIAGGAELFQVRPGAEGIQKRPLPSELGEGPVSVTAVERRPGRRYAAATYGAIVIFAGDQLLRLGGRVPHTTHLAWGSMGEASTLYILRADEVALQMKPDLSDMGEIPLEGVAALASDDAGTVALIVAATEDVARAYVTKDGEQFLYRGLPEDIDIDGHVHLAVAGMAVAFATEGGGVWLSRGQADPFVRCIELGDGGPLAFEGGSEQAALFGAVHEAAMTSIVRIEPGGAAMRIAELASEELAPPQLSALAWDASRRRLWAASPDAGLLSSSAPASKGGKDKGMTS